MASSDSIKDHHVWKFQEKTGPYRPHWSCERCGSKIYTDIGTKPSSTRTMQGYSCNDLIAFVIMDG